jgi:hypothetical protein
VRGLFIKKGAYSRRFFSEIFYVMSEIPTADNAGPLANRSVGQRSRLKAEQMAKDHRRGLVVAGFALSAAIIALLAISTVYPTSPRTSDVLPNNTLRIGKVTNNSIDDKKCGELIFDNQTGRMVSSEQPCDTTAFGSIGVMTPSGTIHRLDAISKSFSGR